MSRIAEYCTVLHIHKRLLCDNVLAACYCYKEISDLCSLFHFHYLEAVHYSLHSLYRVYFGYDNACAKSLCSHCNTLAAPAVACNDHILACNDKVRRSVDPVPYRLTCAVSVVKKILAFCVVYKHHREFQLTFLVHCDKSDYAGGGFLTAADNVRDKLRILVVDKVYKVSAIVDYNVRTYLYDLGNVLVILLRSCAVPCKNIKSVMNKTCRNIVLS